MEYLFNRIEKILEKFKSAQRLLFFFDYDGTLTPIVNHPEKAKLSKEQKGLLTAFRNYPKFILAIVSGRSLKDIQRRVGLKGIYYIGNHGLEISGPGFEKRYPFGKEVILELKTIRVRLEDQLERIGGLFFEDKGWILAIHYRNVDPQWVPSILMALKQEVKDSPIPLCIKFGKMVFEIRPKVDVDKGKAVLEVLNRLHSTNLFPLYIGDDQTDEDAFRILNQKGITIFVGPPSNSSAQYYVHGPFEVYQFLKMAKKELILQ